MGTCTESPSAAQDRRVRLKQQGQMLQRQVVDGTNLSNWEARILISAVEEVYFREVEDRPLRDGELDDDDKATDDTLGHQERP